MDLTDILYVLGALSLGLVLGGCISIGAFLIVVCILYGAYYVVNALINIGNSIISMVASLKKEEPEEEERHIGFNQNLIDIKEDN